jgi:hypothetical protein
VLFVRDDVIRVVDVVLVSASFSRVLLRANSKLLMALGNSGGGSFTVKGLHINKLVLLEAEPSVVQRLAPKRAAASGLQRAHRFHATHQAYHSGAQGSRVD